MEEHEIVSKIVSQYPKERTWLLPILWKVSEKLGGLNPARVEWLAQGLDIPYAEIYGVASFYSLFRWEHTVGPAVHVCTDVMCALQSGDRLYDDLNRAALAEGTFTAVPVTCLGRCDGAPACLVHYTPVKKATAGAVLNQVQALIAQQGKDGMSS